MLQHTRQNRSEICLNLQEMGEANMAKPLRLLRLGNGYMGNCIIIPPFVTSSRLVTKITKNPNQTIPQISLWTQVFWFPQRDPNLPQPSRGWGCPSPPPLSAPDRHALWPTCLPSLCLAVILNSSSFPPESPPHCSLP